MSDVRAHGTFYHDCVVECLPLIFIPVGVEDDEETNDDEGTCRAGRKGYLRQTYARLAPRLALQVGRYAHAKQFRRMRKALKRLKGYSGRVMRDLRRHPGDLLAGALRDRVAAKLALVSRLLHQAPRGSDKIYALHEPEVDCISKGKPFCPVVA